MRRMPAGWQAWLNYYMLCGGSGIVESKCGRRRRHPRANFGNVLVEEAVCGVSGRRQAMRRGHEPDGHRCCVYAGGRPDAGFCTYMAIVTEVPNVCWNCFRCWRTARALVSS